MPALRDHIPLAIVTIALSVAVFILFKEVKAAKEHALAGSRFAASFQEQQQQQHQQLLVMSQPAFAEDAAAAQAAAAHADDVQAPAAAHAVEPRPESRRVTIKEEIEEIPADPPVRRSGGKRA